MRRYKISITPEAIKDLEEIFEYISVELFSPTVAKRQIRRIEKVIASLKTMPKRVRVFMVSESTGKELRRLNTGNYAVVFSVREDTVEVLHVLYGSSNFKALIE